MRAYPFVGQLPSFLADKLGFLERAANTGGPVVRLRLPGPTYLLREPDDIRHVLVTRHTNYVKGLRLTGPRGRHLFGDGLLRSTGDAHRRRRLVLQPLFHQKLIGAFEPVVVKSVSELADSWRPGSEIDAAETMSRLAQRIMLRSLFGPLGAGELARLVDAVDARRRYIEHVFLSPLPFRESLPTPIRRRHVRATAELDAAIATRRANGSLVSLLAGARADDGAALSDADVRDEALTLAITGFETLGDALAWTWYLLAANQPAYERLTAELDSELGDRPVGAGDLQRLPYAQMVLSESLRLYPPTWLYLRVAREDDTLPSGAAIEAGAKLYLSPYLTHRDPRFFPEPELFDPERFAPDVARERPKHAYFPFGSGPHVCLGETFARMEAGLVLAVLARRFRPQLAEAAPIRPRPAMTLTPDGPIRMLVLERDQARVTA